MIAITPSSGAQTGDCPGCCYVCHACATGSIACCFSSNSEVTLTLGTISGNSITAPAISGQTVTMTWLGIVTWGWTSSSFYIGSDQYRVFAELEFLCGFDAPPSLSVGAEWFNPNLADPDNPSSPPLGWEQVEGFEGSTGDYDCCGGDASFDDEDTPSLVGSATWTITNNPCCRVTGTGSGNLLSNDYTCQKAADLCDGTCPVDFDNGTNDGYNNLSPSQYDNMQ